MSLKQSYYTGSKSDEKTNTGLAKFMNTVYLWMALGVALSAIVANWVVSSPTLLRSILSGGTTMILFILQIGCVLMFNRVAQRCSHRTLAALFLFYCALTGLTFSVLLMIYTKASIVHAFVAAAASFAALCLFGLTTKRSLGAVGSFCMVGLVGILIVQLLGFFFPSIHSGASEKVISSLGVLIFAGLTAYDNQKIKQMYLATQSGAESRSQSQKLALTGALKLYLDFINLFIFLLRLTGSRR